MRDAGSDVLAFAFANAGGFLPILDPLAAREQQANRSGTRTRTYFFLPAIGFAGPLRVRALVWVR